MADRSELFIGDTSCAACGQHNYICLCCTPNPDEYDTWKAMVPRYLNRDIFRMQLGLDEKNARIKGLEEALRIERVHLTDTRTLRDSHDKRRKGLERERDNYSREMMNEERRANAANDLLLEWLAYSDSSTLPVWPALMRALHNKTDTHLNSLAEPQAEYPGITVEKDEG